MRVLVIGILGAALPLAAGADEVFLKSGGRLSGRIVSRTASALEVDIGAGQITVPASYVVRVEEGRSPLHDYQGRAGRHAAAPRRSAASKCGRPSSALPTTAAAYTTPGSCGTAAVH